MFWKISQNIFNISGRHLKKLEDLIGNFGRESPVNLSWVSLEISDQIEASTKCTLNYQRKQLVVVNRRRPTQLSSTAAFMQNRLIEGQIFGLFQ